MFKISMMLSQNGVVAIFETEHICPSLLCCEIEGVTEFILRVSSLANTSNKRVSYLVSDQTPDALCEPCQVSSGRALEF